MVKVVDDFDENTKRVSYVLLEDGTILKGESFGASTETEGELGKFKFNKRNSKLDLIFY